MDSGIPGQHRRGKFIIVVGLILAVVAGGAAFYLVNQANQQAGQATLQKIADRRRGPGDPGPSGDRRRGRGRPRGAARPDERRTASSPIPTR